METFDEKLKEIVNHIVFDYLKEELDTGKPIDDCVQQLKALFLEAVGEDEPEECEPDGYILLHSVRRNKLRQEIRDRINGKEVLTADDNHTKRIRND